MRLRGLTLVLHCSAALPYHQALVICLKLLRDITTRGQIPDSKKMFQSLAAACLSVLEKSDNIVLLTTVMGFVKDWLLKEPPLPSAPSLSDQVCRRSLQIDVFQPQSLPAPRKQVATTHVTSLVFSSVLVIKIISEA